LRRQHQRLIATNVSAQLALLGELCPARAAVFEMALEALQVTRG
jgi:hypothetical protein